MSPLDWSPLTVVKVPLTIHFNSYHFCNIKILLAQPDQLRKSLERDFHMSDERNLHSWARRLCLWRKEGSLLIVLYRTVNSKQNTKQIVKASVTIHFIFYHFLYSQISLSPCGSVIFTCRTNAICTAEREIIFMTGKVWVRSMMDERRYCNGTL